MREVKHTILEFIELWQTPSRVLSRDALCRDRHHRTQRIWNISTDMHDILGLNLAAIVLQNRDIKATKSRGSDIIWVVFVFYGEI